MNKFRFLLPSVKNDITVLVLMRRAEQLRMSRDEWIRDGEAYQRAYKKLVTRYYPRSVPT